MKKLLLIIVMLFTIVVFCGCNSLKKIEGFEYYMNQTAFNNGKDPYYMVPTKYKQISGVDDKLDGITIINDRIRLQRTEKAHEYDPSGGLRSRNLYKLSLDGSTYYAPSIVQDGNLVFFIEKIANLPKNLKVLYVEKYNEVYASNGWLTGVEPVKGPRTYEVDFKNFNKAYNQLLAMNKNPLKYIKYFNKNYN